MAASSAAGWPSTSASGNSRSAVWFSNQASPRLQAFLLLTIRSPSACSSMSSHTQPQKVQVAFLTTVRLMPVSYPVLPPAPSRAARRTFSQAPGRGSSRESGAAATVRGRSTPSLERVPGGRASRRCRVAYRSRHRLHFDLPPLGGGHPRPVSAASHEPAGWGAVGDEDHSQRDLPLGALEGGLAVRGPDPDAPARGHAYRLHVLGMHGHRAHDRTVLGVVLPDVDLLALLGGATRVHEEALARHWPLPMLG